MAGLKSAPIDRYGWKRLGDSFLAVALMILILPVMILVAVAIKFESRGPVFVWEHRSSGRRNRFAALKFRTTIIDMERYRATCYHEKSCKLTRVGLFLRCTRMDNLPQLVNVLRGEMTCIVCGSELPFFLD